MIKNFVRFSGFVLIALFILGCSSEKIESLVTTPIPIKNPEKDISAEEFEKILEKQAKKSPGTAIRVEQFATEETRLEIEKLQKEKETLVAEIEKEKKSKEIFREGVKRTEEEKKQLSQQVSQLSQEKERIKNLSDLIPIYQQKISVLEAEVSALKKEQADIQNKKEKAQEVPSVVGSEPEQTVPVGIESSKRKIVTYFKITSKKTGKSYIYGVPDPTHVYLVVLDHNYSRIINLAPGEYTVQITTEYPLKDINLPSPQTFTVSEEPIADFQGKKVHAVVSY